jgi:hypothetical protein
MILKRIFKQKYGAVDWIGVGQGSENAVVIEVMNLRIL